ADVAMRPEHVGREDALDLHRRPLSRPRVERPEDLGRQEVLARERAVLNDDDVPLDAGFGAPELAPELAGRNARCPCRAAGPADREGSALQRLGGGNCGWTGHGYTSGRLTRRRTRGEIEGAAFGSRLRGVSRFILAGGRLA